MKAMVPPQIGLGYKDNHVTEEFSTHFNGLLA